MAENAPNGEVAAATTAGGWPVFPCLARPERGRKPKAPATPHGFYDATTDATQVAAWWEHQPDRLVGVPTAGLVVVDLDVDPDRCTWTWWQDLADEHRWDIRRNLVVETPSGGVHVYFAAPPGPEVGSSTGKVAPHVDVRAEGGYVIAPGSTMPDGSTYEVLHLPDQLPVAPRWLVEMLTAPRSMAPTDLPRPDRPGGTRYGLAALDREVGRVATAPEGQRNDTLVRAAFRLGQLAAGGQLDPVHAAEHLEVAALRAGLDQAETTATIRSGMAAGGQHPRRPAA